MAEFSVFDFETTLVLMWHERISLEGVRRCIRTAENMKGRTPICFLTVIGKDTPIDTPREARKELARFLKNWEEQISAAAIAYEATGFKATALRSIVTAINLTARTTFPNKVFQSLDEAAAWLMLTSKGTPEAAQRLVKACRKAAG